MTQSKEIGKIPPQALDMEEAVLGAAMIDRECLPAIMDILTPESFYKEAHSKVFSAIFSLYKGGNPVDTLTVAQELFKRKELQMIGGGFVINELANKISSGLNAEYHARIIQQRFIAREVIRIAQESMHNAYDEGADCIELVESMEKGLNSILKNFIGGKVNTMVSLWKQFEEKNDLIVKSKGVSGIPTGYKNIDRLTSGWQNSDLIILAARPAMGKTALALNFMLHAAAYSNIPCAFFSLEMSALQLVTRMISMESNTSNNIISRIGLKPDEMVRVQNHCSRLINAPLYIDDTPGITSLELRSKARKLVRDKGVKFIAIDYLQLMVGDKNASKGGREQEISSISRALKGLAKELQVPIIALSQLNRAVETRGGDKRPQLSDLRESGAIEQDADMVMFLHRPEYYGIMEDENGGSYVGVAEVIFAKHRNGPVGTESILYKASLTKFVDYDHDFSEQISGAIQPNEAF